MVSSEGKVVIVQKREREREKMMRNKKKGTYHQEKDKRRMKGFKHDL